MFKSDDTAMELYRRFRDEEKAGRLLTIAASHPAVLSLPWELLRPPGGVFLFAENPRIAIRRGLPAAGQGHKPHQPKAQDVLRVLFIVSRPEGAGFINPRTDAQAVLNALDMQEHQRAEVEFLRPATLTALEERLRDTDLPAVDIIHFDGHGVFDRNGSLAKLEGKTELPPYMQDLLREERGCRPAGSCGHPCGAGHDPQRLGPVSSRAARPAQPWMMPARPCAATLTGASGCAAQAVRKK